MEKRITLLVQGLEAGGTERQVATLATQLAKIVPTQVLSFKPGGLFWNKLQTSTEVKLHALSQGGVSRLPVVLFRLYQYIQQHQSNVVYSFLPAANCVTTMIRPFCKNTTFVFGKRAANMDLTPYHFVTRASYALEKYFSPCADLLIFNSHTAKRYAHEQGFKIAKEAVIFNGIDTAQFKPDSEKRQQFRSMHRIAQEKKVIGMVSRFDPVKNFPLFLKTAALIRQAHPNVVFVCVGGEKSTYTESLKAMSKTLGLESQLVWLEAMQDPSLAYNGMDYFLFTSSSESFPNVLAEAMACGLPIVSTDVGDAKEILAPFFKPVEADAETLANAVSLLMHQSIDPHALHQHVVKNFSIDRMVSQTLEVIS